MPLNIDEMANRTKFENRIASGYYKGERLTVQARVASRKDPLPSGTPYIYAGFPGNKSRETFDTVEEMVERFEALKDEYDLEE